MEEGRKCLTVCGGQVFAFSSRGQVIISLIRDVPVTLGHAFSIGIPIPEARWLHVNGPDSMSVSFTVHSICGPFV